MTTQSMFSRKFIIFQIIFLIAVAVSFVLYFRLSAIQPLPIVGVVADFKLQSSDNQEVSLGALKGKIWVADFMFTSCGNICPMLTKNMNILHRSFHDNNDVRLVSISVNPENDSPQVLSRYAQRFRIDTQRWFFLTGTREDISKLVIGSFKVGDIKEPIFHSPHFVLVDRNANIRGYYDGTDATAVKKIAQDLAQLLKEK